MSAFKPFFLALAATAAFSAHATTINLITDGSWNEFDVAADVAASGTGTQWIDNFTDASRPQYRGDGSDLSFSFTIADGFVGTLTVVDAGQAGDTFDVISNGSSLGATSVVPVGIYSDTAPITVDFDAALADATYSRGVYTLAAGSYRVTGNLLTSVQWPFRQANGELNLNSTIGGLKVEVAAVPEPSAVALLLAGVAALGLVARRRAA